MKFKNPASRFAIVGVFVADTAGGPRVAVTGAGPSVFRAAGHGEGARGEVRRRIGGEHQGQPDSGLNTDIHASAEYRAHLVTVMAKRAVAAALA